MAIRSGAAHIHCEKAYKNDLSKYSGYYAGTLFEISLRTDHFDASLADEEEFEW